MSYTVTVSTTSDDYKRPTNDVRTYRAETIDDARAIALEAYFEEVIDRPWRVKALAKASSVAETVFAVLQPAFSDFEPDEDADDDAVEAAEEAHEKAKEEARLKVGQVIEPLIEWLQENEQEVFRGEYVPQTIEVVIKRDDEEFDERPDLGDSFESLYYQLGEALTEVREEAAKAAEAPKAKGKKAK